MELHLTEERLTELMALAVKKGLGDHPCRYLLDPRTVDHVMGMLSDIGDGDLRRGVEIVRENHKWICNRLEKDKEYTANHGFVSKLRGASENTLMRFVSLALLGILVVTAVGVFGFFAAHFSSMAQLLRK